MLRRQSSGFSLIELMLALVVGMSVALCLSSLHQSLLQIDVRALSRIRLQQGVQVLLDVMERDLRRAGYRAFRPGMKPVAAAPSLYLAPHCLVVLMDIDADGVHRGEQEIRGYRFNESGERLEVNSWLRTKTQPTSYCRDSGWQDMADGAIRVSNFQLLPVVEGEAHPRLYVMRLSAHDAQHPELEVHDERRFWLRNQ
ncbi:prepilin-type N-terminal cleavage/methylation domain-containing protein [Pseudaeromonas pectinilytica]